MWVLYFLFLFFPNLEYIRADSSMVNTCMRHKKLPYFPYQPKNKKKGQEMNVLKGTVMPLLGQFSSSSYILVSMHSYCQIKYAIGAKNLSRQPQIPPR